MGRQPTQTRTSHGPKTRPRYPRIAAAGASTLVTLVAVLGATGVLPIDGTPEAAYAGTPPPQSGSPAGTNAPAVPLSALVSRSLPWLPPIRVPSSGSPSDSDSDSDSADAALPRRSGEGRRIVFDMSAQRVWLVSAEDNVRRSYLVSGSLTDNLGPGSYSVYSKSRHAVGIDNSGTMGYMVRFTQGENAAIGFHDIPVLGGEKVQTRRELGEPQSHGCIRQLRKDAKALWEFAPIGTTVVVID
ncbi:MAG TPA: L,D-transpeptidase [Nocardioidaceae bacterium]|nr:L,D-transpeptidase [Nocardioidaceae bacterium]